MPFLTTGKDTTEKQGAGRAEERRENKPIQNFLAKHTGQVAHY